MPEPRPHPALRCLWPLLLCLAGCSPGQEPAGLVPLPGSTPGAPRGQAAPVERPYFHDFGQVPHGQVVSHTFQLVNTDPEPVTLRRMIPSCSCTVAGIEILDAGGRSLGPGDLAGDNGIATVPVGGRALVTLRVESRAVEVTNADKLVQIRLQSDSRYRPWLTLEAHLLVIQDLLATPNPLEFSAVPQSEGAVREVVVRPNRELLEGVPPELSLGPPLKVPAPLEVHVYPHPQLPGLAWQVMVDLPPDQPLGPLVDEIVFSTVDAQGLAGPPFHLPVRAQISPDYGADPSRAYLMPSGKGGHATGRIVLLTRRANAPFSIARYEVEAIQAGGLRVESRALGGEPEGPASQWELLLEANWDPGETPPAGTLTVVLDDDKGTRVEIPYELLRQP